MIGKLLLTLLVMALAVVYLRKQAARRRQQDAATARQAAAAPTQVDRFLASASSSGHSSRGKGQLSGSLRWLLWSLALVVILGGSLYTYHRWQEHNQEITVLLYRDGGESPVVYRVPRHSLGERSFVTHDGIRVTVSATERMEVVGL